MSPRAACQLERFGFEHVYDFVGGKLEWLANGLPTEGAGPHYAVAGEVIRRQAPKCRPDQTAGEIRRAIQELGGTVCAVVDDDAVVLGRVRLHDLPPDDDVPVEEFMKLGPATIRPTEPLRPLVERMRKAGVGTILVTSSKGRLLGVVHRRDAEARLEQRP